jgi:DNA modification methylase
MAGMPEASVDAVVCDPPYFLHFMGRSWDRAPSAKEQQEQHYAWAIEAFRVLRPGGHLLAFGGTRTVHRLACAIEDAGFEIRDRLLHLGGDATEPPGELAWIYGSG